jgi:hypothetical protein
MGLIDDLLVLERLDENTSLRQVSSFSWMLKKKNRYMEFLNFSFWI